MAGSSPRRARRGASAGGDRRACPQRGRRGRGRQQAFGPGQQQPGTIIVETGEGTYLLQPQPGFGAERRFHAFGPPRQPGVAVMQPQPFGGGVALQDFGRELYARGYLQGRLEEQLARREVERRGIGEIRQNLQQALRQDEPQQAQTALQQIEQMLQRGEQRQQQPLQPQ